MDKAAGEQIAAILEEQARLARKGKLKWVWLSTETPDGYRITVGTKEAPRRPQGLGQ